jgi:hypothetical protein
MQQTSSYGAEFPNWKNGQQDVYHEKHPQYPYYSLPFAGNSNYAQAFTEEQMKKLRQQQEMLGQIGSNTNSTLR